MGTSIFPIMAPGITVARTASSRVVFRQRGEHYLAGGLTISGQASRDPGNTDVAVLRAGLLMGRIATVVNSLGTIGYYAPSILGVTTNAEAIGSTSIQASAAVITELVRRCGSSGTFTLLGPPAANGVIASETVTYSAASSTNITATATANAYVAGSFIMPTDGSQIPRTFIDDLMQYGIQVVDGDAASVAAIDYPRVPIDGILYSSQLLPVWPSDTSLQTWIFSRLNDVPGGHFSGDHHWLTAN